jgi:hypothetical protein
MERKSPCALPASLLRSQFVLLKFAGFVERFTLARGSLLVFSAQAPALFEAGNKAFALLKGLLCVS